MKYFLPPLLLGILLALTACSPAEPLPTVTPTAAPTATATPAPSAAPTAPAPAAAPAWGVQEGVYRQTVPDEPETMLVEGRFSLPYIENAADTAAYTAINRWYAQLLEALKGDVRDTVALALDDYETARSLEIPFLGYSHEVVYQVVYESETTAAVLRSHFAHSSGPFPSLLCLVDRFDLQRGLPLGFTDFFTDPAQAEAIILAEVMRQGAEHPEYSQEALVSAFSREYFYPAEDGLLFYYQPLTLNDEAAVKPEFLVPYGLLEGLLSR